MYIHMYSVLETLLLLQSDACTHTVPDMVTAQSSMERASVMRCVSMLMRNLALSLNSMKLQGF